jgi:Flp pilus assembly pilin Flp
MKPILLEIYVKFRDLISREEGQDLVEYGLIIALICMVVISNVRVMGPAISSIFANLSTAIGGL